MRNIEIINEWITNIILFVLLATIIDMLLPNSSMQKYVKLVLGLLLIAIILSPILKLLTNDFETLMQKAPNWDNEVEEKMENSIEVQKKEIQAFQDAYILEETAEKLKYSAEEVLMEEQGLEILDIKILLNGKSETFPENLQKITVYIKESEKATEAVAMVEKIEINTNTPSSTDDQRIDSEKIASYLSEKWNIEEEIIEIIMEGGDM